MLIGPKINYVADGLEVTPTVATTTTPGAVDAAHPVSNVLEESMESVVRWNIASAAHCFVDIELGTLRTIDTVVLAGLTVNRNTRVRLRYAPASTWPWVEELLPNGYVSDRLTYAVGDLDNDPDDPATVAWPTHGGGGTTITDRFQFPTPTLTPWSGDQQIIRVRTGGVGGNAHSYSNFELYESGSPSGNPSRGAFMDDLGASQASGGRLVELWWDADDITTIANFELATPTVAGTPSAYSATASLRWYCPTSDTAQGSTTTDWISVLNDSNLLPGYSSPGGYLELAYRRVNVVIRLAAPVSVSALRVEIDPHSLAVPTAHAAGAVELAHVATGESLQLGFSPGASTTHNLEESEIRRSASGLPFVRLGSRRRRLNLALTPFDEDARRELELYFQRRQGLGRYMWVIPEGSDDPDGQFMDAIWGTQAALEQIPYAFKTTGGKRFYRTRLSVEEVRDD